MTQAAPPSPAAGLTPPASRSYFRDCLADESHELADHPGVRLHRNWEGDVCRLSIENTGDTPAKLNDLIVLDCPMPFPPACRFYGEGYNMLSQYAGTLTTFREHSRYSDAHHYRLPQKPGFFTVYNLLHLQPEGEPHQLLAFASCRRFSGRFCFNTQRLQVILDGEGSVLGAGETLALEDLLVAPGPDPSALYAALADRLQTEHPRPSGREIPTGWCSWYCYGPDISEGDIQANLAAASEHIPSLRYIQIDDGYERRMGDWLEPGDTFPDGMPRLCEQIRQAGFEPAVWVAPFIAEEDSRLFREHPDWFIQDDKCRPLRSSDVTFGGWRCGPWYMLDGSHPAAQDYLKHVFATMRNDWGCRYFKLDANTWGALPFGRHHEPSATSVIAYRSGMDAIRRGAGDDAFILGCNAAMWPSIGCVDGMRVTGDISRHWHTFKALAQECFARNWQHQTLWTNDPDCMVLNNQPIHLVGPGGEVYETRTDITDDQFRFHATAVLASGGMVLSGDRTPDLSTEQIAVIEKLAAHRGLAARFDDQTFSVGRIPTANGMVLCLFNFGDFPASCTVPLDGPHAVRDFWTDEPIAPQTSAIADLRLPPTSAAALVCERRGSR